MTQTSPIPPDDLPMGPPDGEDESWLSKMIGGAKKTIKAYYKKNPYLCWFLIAFFVIKKLFYITILYKVLFGRKKS